MITSLFVILYFFSHVTCSKILMVMSWPAVSHENCYIPIWKELSLRGHEVTALTTRPLNDPTLVNLTEIDVSFMYKIARDPAITNKLRESSWMGERMYLYLSIMEKLMVKTLEMKEVKKLVRNKADEFDLIVVGPLHPLVFAFGAKLNAPIVALSTLTVCLYVHDSQGNPTHPIINPDVIFPDFEADTIFEYFIDRMNKILYNIWYRLFHYCYLIPYSDAIVKKYFGLNSPYLGDIINNISLVLMTTNPILNSVRPNVPSVVPIGLTHIDKTQELSEDVKEFLDASTNGVVYFSLGTNVVISTFCNGTIKLIIDSLSELPYDILLKYESDNHPSLPKNVFIKKWLPQQAVLNHKNVKVFITQGGVQSVEESLYYGVPMVVMPMMADQHINAKNLVEFGVALKLDFNKLNKDNFKQAVIKVATNPRYKKRVLEAKAILKDEPLIGVDKVIWWLEYVIRHNGATHLKGKHARVPFYDYLMLDVIAILFISSFIFVKFIIVTLSVLKKASMYYCKIKYD